MVIGLSGESFNAELDLYTEKMCHRKRNEVSDFVSLEFNRNKGL